MSNKREVKDIKEEWQLMLRNSSSNPVINVAGGWLQAAIPQLFEYINVLTEELEEVRVKNAHSRDRNEQYIASLKAELFDAKAKI